MLAADDFIPSLELARTAGIGLKARVWWRMGLEVDLLERAPIETRKLAAIVVRGRALRRRRLAYRTEIPEAHAVGIPEAAPSPPAGFFNQTATIVERLLSEPRRCTCCHNGRTLCGTCSGEGWVLAGDREGRQVQRACPACVGGTLQCKHCDGTARSLEVRCVDIVDDVGDISYAYVPTMTFGLEEKVTQLLEAEASAPGPMPVSLRVSLEAERTGGPYRQATREPEFRGFRYAEALPQARSALAALRGEEPIREELEITARPILWMRYDFLTLKREVALVIATNGDLHAMVADGGVF